MKKFLQKLKCWLGFHDWEFDRKAENMTAWSTKKKCSRCNQRKTIEFLKL